MTCKHCTETAIAIVDDRGRVRRPTHTAPIFCVVHAAGEAAVRIIRPALNVSPGRWAVVDPGAHARSVGGHKSQRGF